MNILNIISIVCFALCLVMFFYFRWYIKKRTVSSGFDDRITELARLGAEIDRLTDRDSQLIEERVVKLKAILDDTDKRIAVYVREMERSRAGETLYASLGKGIRDIFDTNEETFPEDTIKISKEAKAPEAVPPPPAQTLTSPAWRTVMSEKIEEYPPVKEKETSVSTPSLLPSRQQIRAHIDLLIDEGYSAEQIASQLGISVAEVNLAINLRRR